MLWWTWTGTTAYINRFAGDDVPHRMLTFIQMFAVGTFAIASASTSLTDATSWLVAAYLGARIPLLIMYWRAKAVVPGEPIINLFVGSFGSGAALWALSLAFAPGIRPWIWALALVVEFLTPIVALHRLPAAPPVHDEHLRERYALFTIIVLGETFVKTASEITQIGMSAQTTVFGTLAFTMLIAMWWTYFDDVAESEITPRSLLGNSVSANRAWWVYTHLPLAAGLTAYGVAAKKVASVAEFGDYFKASSTWLLFGALITVLVSVAVVDIGTVSPHFGVRSRQRAALRLAAVLGLLVVAWPMAAGTISALTGIVLFTAVLVAQIGTEILIATRAERRVDSNLKEFHGAAGGTCAHLEESETPPREGSSCPTCEDHGVPWVQLRRCLTCGYVGCCDDSPGRHATTHFEESGHPTIASIEPTQDWAFCYLDKVTDADWWVQRTKAASASSAD